MRDEQANRDPTVVNEKGKSFDSKSMDRLMRYLLAFPQKSARKRNRRRAAKQKRNAPKSSQGAADIHDLVYAHFVSASRFGDDSREYASRLLRQIHTHPALGQLEDDARVVAAVSICQAHRAYRLRTSGTYWILEGLGPHYPFPLGIRTGQFPRWRRPARSLGKLLTGLRASRRQVIRLEGEAVVGSRPSGMPTDLILEAESALQRAVDWMRAFPSPVKLRSRYREIMRPNKESESTDVVAYVLDRLFREHSTEPRRKIKELECRIAEMETAFLAQSIHSDPHFGSPAVRAQILAVKRSDRRKVIDRSIETQLKGIEFQHWLRLKSEEVGSPSKLNRLLSAQCYE